MQLINVDPVQAQPFEASLDCLAKVPGSCIMSPLIGARAVPATLSRDDEPSRIRKQRLGNQFLAYIWTVGIRGIDEIDTELNGTAKYRQRPTTISWRSPDTFAGKAHRPETETMHGNLPAKRNISSLTRRKFFLVHDCPPKFSSQPNPTVPLTSSGVPPPACNLERS
jgi:hypothetical protein